MSKEILTLASAIRVAAMQLQVSCEEVIGRLSNDKTTTTKASKKSAPADDMEEVESPYKDEKKGNGKKNVQSAKAEEDTNDLAQDDDDMFGDDAADEDTGPTLDDVRKVVKDFATKHGKEKALKLLGKFKVTSIPDIKKADYAKVIELAKKHL